MKSFNIFAISALLGLAAAVPLGKRDVVWVTVTEEVIEYIDSTTTYFVNAGTIGIATGTSVDAAPTPNAVPVSKAQDLDPAKPDPNNAAVNAVVVPAAAPPVQAPSSTSSALPAKDSAAAQFYALPPSSSTISTPAPAPHPTPPVNPAPPSTISSSSSSSSPPIQSPPPQQDQSPSSPSSSGSLPEYLPGGTAPTTCTPGHPCKGDMTTYNPSEGVGACGYKDDGSIYTDSDMVVAIAVKMMGSKSNNGVPGVKATDLNALCGRKIGVKHPKTGKTATATVVDKCFGCPGNADIDFSPAFFSYITGGETTGRIAETEWWWL